MAISLSWMADGWAGSLDLRRLKPRDEGLNDREGNQISASADEKDRKIIAVSALQNVADRAAENNPSDGPHHSPKTNDRPDSSTGEAVGDNGEEIC